MEITQNQEEALLYMLMEFTDQFYIDLGMPPKDIETINELYIQLENKAEKRKGVFDGT